MPVKKYIPPVKQIIDHRSDKGGYYEALCEECGGDFYPKKSNAMYCSPQCTLINWRRGQVAKVNDKKPAKKSVKKVADSSQPIMMIRKRKKGSLDRIKAELGISDDKKAPAVKVNDSSPIPEGGKTFTGKNQVRNYLSTSGVVSTVHGILSKLGSMGPGDAVTWDEKVSITKVSNRSYKIIQLQ